MEEVVLVDENDNAIGKMEKIKAHEQALLHRAFSIFVFNEKGEVMLQQRQLTKYHSGGLWTNTCCGHPRPGEETKVAAERRLFEEMGFRCSLTKKFDFIYKTKFSNELTEYEFDHVFFGFYNGLPVLNEEEAKDWAWMKWDNLVKDVADNPEKYTFWAKICIEKVTAEKLLS